MKRRAQPISNSSRSSDSDPSIEEDQKPKAVKRKTNDGNAEIDESKSIPSEPDSSTSNGGAVDGDSQDENANVISGVASSNAEQNDPDHSSSSSSSELELSGAASSDDNADEEVASANNDTTRSQSPSAEGGQRISTPTKFDVLFGRGFSYQMHPGNLRLHTVVNRHKARYANAKRLEKRAIIAEVVNLIKNGGPQNARFLEQGAGSGKSHWIEQSDKRAMEKVGHALRGKPRNTKKGASPSPSAAAAPVAGSSGGSADAPLAVSSNPTVASSSGVSSRQPANDNYPYPISVTERDERRQLLNQISLLDTETLTAIVRQHSAGVFGGRSLAPPTQPLSLAAATPFALGTQYFPVGLPRQSIVASDLLSPASAFATAAAARPDLLHQAQISALTMGSRQAEFADPTLVAALLRQSHLQQSMLVGGQQQEEARRLLEAISQSRQQNVNESPGRSRLSQNPPS